MLLNLIKLFILSGVFIALWQVSHVLAFIYLLLII